MKVNTAAFAMVVLASAFATGAWTQELGRAHLLIEKYPDEHQIDSILAETVLALYRTSRGELEFDIAAHIARCRDSQAIAASSERGA